ncbi:MAG: efflux RND transporter periplasmic adaptor subunit [Candidatus Moranbacteria bacterium]|nr:efflux RND transporter periplasmic adaptor subunit [Candidatus Moranbacteria bacterium]MBP9801408.1 efflux RND transporter periplasmic adaptor subunit [Candidatus Moranbacteria bacterium]
MLISLEFLNLAISMFTPGKNRLSAILKHSPFVLFFSALAILFAVIVIAGVYRQPEKITSVPTKEATRVDRFIVGTNTVTTTASAIVKKETLQPLVALTSGVVQSVFVHPGSRVSAGAPLFHLSADYGTNRAKLETLLAKKNQQFALDMAELDREILSLEKQKARPNKTKIDTETDIALKQLKRQRAELEFSLSSGALSVDISRANAAVWKPRAIVSGTIEHIAVQAGDFVTPGTLLAMIRTEKGATTLDAFIDPTLARAFDITLPSHILFQTEAESIAITPSFFSQSETKDGFFAIRYLLSQDQSAQVADNTRVTLSLPLRTENKEKHTLIPLDALFTHTNHTSIFIERDGKAEEQTVSVQEIFGNAALLSETLPIDTSVLLNRTLVAGETITFAQ